MLVSETEKCTAKYNPLCIILHKISTILSNTVLVTCSDMLYLTYF